MKLFLITASFLLMGISTISAQAPMAQANPLDFWAGEWVQKTTSIDPAPATDDWKSQVVLNEFIPILNGGGLYRVATAGYEEVEGYFFYDAGAGKVYGTSIDEYGNFWQTESDGVKDGRISVLKGGPKNDDSVGVESRLERINENEVQFTQFLYEDGKVTTTIKGVFIRIPWSSSDED